MRSKDPIPTMTPIAHPGTRYSTSVSRPSCDVIVVGEVGVEEVISDVCVGRTSKEVKAIYITSLVCFLTPSVAATINTIRSVTLAPLLLMLLKAS